MNERSYLSSTFEGTQDNGEKRRGAEGDVINREWRSRSRSKVCRKIRERASFPAWHRPTWSLSLRNRAASEYGASSSFAPSYDPPVFFTIAPRSSEPPPFSVRKIQSQHVIIAPLPARSR